MPQAAQEQILTGGTLNKLLSVRTENTEMPPVDPNDAGVEEQELVCLVEDLEGASPGWGDEGR